MSVVSLVCTNRKGWWVGSLIVSTVQGGVDKELGVQILYKLYAVICFSLFGFILH